MSYLFLLGMKGSKERKNIRKKGVQKRWMHIMNKEKKKNLTKKGKRK